MLTLAFRELALVIVRVIRKLPCRLSIEAGTALVEDVTGDRDHRRADRANDGDDCRRIHARLSSRRSQPPSRGSADSVSNPACKVLLA
jgi:hypothetical protein